MPVIGRLDKQVDEVLIAPLEKDKSKGNKTQEEHRGSDVSVKDTPPRADERGERDTLPVWLL